MKIAQISKQNNGKYRVSFDNHEKIITYDEVILNHNLLQNKKIDYELLHKINLDNEYYYVYNKIIKYISIKIRSLKEINDYLIKFNLDTKAKTSIINKLKKDGLIDDKRFARCFIADNFNLSNRGPFLIKKELLKHELSEIIIDQLLSEVKTEEIISKIDRLIAKKVKNNQKHCYYLLKQKILKDLIALGFDSNIIIERLDMLTIDDNDILQKEFDKLYNKYKTKLTLPKLSYKIKQTLYQKGFKIEDINNLLDEKNVQ